ncbi:unnamed protein product [Lepeophtheirus salmonis]|uniref:(salmon louse) hypothetical protein n=1 Tax=Lepeophtheirus salmonis TaxID=72036 RepID=A0A7R8CLL4_LEPSM|nr:unnamed protein product [Lepeophtheirus salmonis]CAF2853573.1 unnamed protein product [Lepeophtheirus salmonis]
MAAKLVYASMVAAASAHSLYVRDTDVKVNRDSYGAPAPASYGAPAPSYSAPASSYNAPSSSYSSGGSSYSAPETGYTSPSGYGEETGGLDLTAIIIPLLALLGLSLLFPTFVSVTARRKRDVDEIGEAKLLTRIYQTFFNTNYTFQVLSKLKLKDLNYTNIMFNMRSSKSMMILVACLFLGSTHAHNLNRRDTGASYSGGAVASSYDGGAPSSSYDAGSASGYAAPSQGYGAPSSGYVESSGTGISGDYGDEPEFPFAAIILPILALIGLALLFPTITTVGVVPPVGRRKRSLIDGSEEGSGPMGRVLDRVNDIYFSMIEKRRISPVTKMIDPLVTKKYKTYYKQFASGRNCQKIKCGSFSL